MQANRITVTIRRDRIQFERCGGEHSTGTEVRHAAWAWEAACRESLERAGYTADVTASHGHDHHKFFVCVTAGELDIYCDARGVCTFQHLTPAQDRFVREVVEAVGAADAAGWPAAEAAASA